MSHVPSLLITIYTDDSNWLNSFSKTHTHPENRWIFIQYFIIQLRKRKLQLKSNTLSASIFLEMEIETHEYGVQHVVEIIYAFVFRIHLTHTWLGWSRHGKFWLKLAAPHQPAGLTI